MTILYIILLSILSGYLYHLGGINHLLRPNFPILRQKPRDVGCSLVVVLSLLAMGIPAAWWVFLIVFGLTWAGLSTYWDWMFNDNDNFWFHGFMIGFAMLPHAIHYGIWIPLIARSILCCVVMGLWSRFTPKIFDIEEARVEEFGRGFIIPLTLLFYL